MDTISIDNSKKAPKGRLGFRVTLYQEALIRKAAELTGKNVTQFVLSSACEAAENALLDQRILFADEKKYNAFLDALERPSEIKPGLKALLESDSPWEK